MSIYILDNGGQYSDRVVWFINTDEPCEILTPIFEKLCNPYRKDPAREPGLLCRADKVDWIKPGLAATIPAILCSFFDCEEIEDFCKVQQPNVSERIKYLFDIGVREENERMMEFRKVVRPLP